MEADWLNGPAFVAWLESKDCVVEYDESGKAKDEAMDRNFRRWRSGQRASIYTVDRLLVRHFDDWGLLLSDVPEELGLAVAA